jgi:hypothetical protein
MRDGQVDTDPDQEPVVEEPVAAGRAGHRGTVPSAVSAAAPGSGSGSTASGRQPAVISASGWTAADRFTSLAPDEAQSRIVQMLAIGGITLTENSPGRLVATATVAGEPNWIVVVVLCFLWLVPGVVYWYVKSRPVAHPLAVQLLPAELGTRVALQGDPVALERIAPVLAQLPW